MKYVVIDPREIPGTYMTCSPAFFKRVHVELAS